MNQTFCNLCDRRTDKLVRRGTFMLCGRCHTQEEYNYAKDLQTDPRATATERAWARKRVRTLGRKLVQMRKGNVA